MAGLVATSIQHIMTQNRQLPKSLASKSGLAQQYGKISSRDTEKDHASGFEADYPHAHKRKDLGKP